MREPQSYKFAAPPEHKSHLAKMTFEKFSAWPAAAAGAIICAALGITALFVPPAMGYDPAVGFLAWNGTLLGHLNSIVSPNPSNVATDAIVFLSTWSPGQYLFPGVISLSGLPLGVAITVTNSIALFISLVGWIFVVRAILPIFGEGVGSCAFDGEPRDRAQWRG